VIFVTEDEHSKPGWRERRKAAKRQKAERTGDSPEKNAERKSHGEDAKDAAGGAAIRGTVSTPPGVGGLGGGGGF
jgi:hypothetical protein